MRYEYLLAGQQHPKMGTKNEGTMFDEALLKLSFYVLTVMLALNLRKEITTGDDTVLVR